MNFIIQGVSLCTFISLVCVCHVVNARFEIMKLLLDFALDKLFLNYHFDMISKHMAARLD